MKLNRKIKLILVLLLSILLFNTGCFVRFGTKNIDPDLKMGLAIDRDQAFEFSNKFIEDVIAERNQEIYSKMSDYFQKAYSLDEIPNTIEKLNLHFGKLIETEYKTEEIGYWMFPDGTKKPMRKFFYAIKTDKADKGKYFLQVSVIADGTQLRCGSFSMLDFPDGVPEQLK